MCGFLFDSVHWHHGGCQSPQGLPVWQVHLAVGEVMAAEKVREAERLFAGGNCRFGLISKAVRTGVLRVRFSVKRGDLRVA